jgi:hypothetical protein
MLDSSGSLAMPAAIRRASSRVSKNVSGPRSGEANSLLPIISVVPQIGFLTDDEFSLPDHGVWIESRLAFIDDVNNDLLAVNRSLRQWRL